MTTATSSKPSSNKSRLTYEHYCLLPDDGKRHEIIDGEHVATPSPTTYHQTVSRRLQFALYEQLELTGRAQVFDAPIDVELALHDIVQPDLVIVATASSQIITPSRIRGIPVLIVEILSPSTRHNDRSLKLELYRARGVAEYWIVDPESHTVEQRRLEGAEYRLVATVTDRIEPVAFDGVVIDLARVW